MRGSARSIRTSVLTAQVLRSLRALERAKELHASDVKAGIATCGTWDGLTAGERDTYRAIAEGEFARPQQFRRRDETIGRDQVTRRERGRVLHFGGSHA